MLIILLTKFLFMSTYLIRLYWYCTIYKPACQYISAKNIKQFKQGRGVLFHGRSLRSNTVHNRQVRGTL